MATYTVKPETNTIIKEYAEQVGVKPEEALDKLILTADSRRKALAKYAEKAGPRKPKAEKAPKAKKAPKGTSLAKKKAAAPKAKKAPKAKAIPVVSGNDAETVSL